MNTNDDKVLCWFSGKDPWTVRDSFTGVQIFGGTGSGKTSGSGNTIFRALLKAGYGGLVLTVKPDDAEQWLAYCKQAGREQDVVIVSNRLDQRFNFLNYEKTRAGAGAGMTENIVNLFVMILKFSERGESGGGSDGFWERGMRQMLRNAIDLLLVAGSPLSLQSIYSIIQSAPHTTDEADQGIVGLDEEECLMEAHAVEEEPEESAEGEPIDKATKPKTKNWWERSFCAQCIGFAARRSVEGLLDESGKKDFEVVKDYWLTEFPRIADKTRSGFIAHFTGMAHPFLRGMFRELFCTLTTIRPEDTHEGKIIIIDLPVKEFGAVGRNAHFVFKYCWQLAAERRAKNGRPIFMAIDESQEFIHEYDMQFFATARSSRVCGVYLTQNLPNYYAMLPGDKGREQVQSVISNLKTKIFHANDGPKTNEWASEVIAKDWHMKTGFSGDKANRNPSFDARIPPIEFSRLATGGAQNKFEVDAIIFQGGRVWEHNKHSYMITSFNQKVR